jgi:hypothetical protein
MPRHLRPLRRRIFIGCEGQSERSYVGVIQNLCNVPNRNLAVHLDGQVIKNTGGDPELILARAEAMIQRLEKAASAYERRYVLLDTDVAVAKHSPAFLEVLSARARHVGIELVWQRCCHEAVLLRHLPECQNLNPPTSDDALRQLLRHISEYRKGWPSERLGRVITLEHVRQAAAVEPELRSMLTAIGLI